MYRGKPKLGKNPAKTLLEKICYYEDSTIMNHALDLFRSIQPAIQNKETLGLDKSHAQRQNINPDKALDPEWSHQDAKYKWIEETLLFK